MLGHCRSNRQQETVCCQRRRHPRRPLFATPVGRAAGDEALGGSCPGERGRGQWERGREMGIHVEQFNNHIYYLRISGFPSWASRQNRWSTASDFPVTPDAWVTTMPKVATPTLTHSGIHSCSSRRFSVFIKVVLVYISCERWAQKARPFYNFFSIQNFINNIFYYDQMHVRRVDLHMLNSV